MWKSLAFVFIFTVVGVLFLTGSVEAIITIPNPLEATTVEALVEGIIDFIRILAFAITPLLIILAGFYFITSAGDPNKVQTAKNIIKYTVIGLVIILLAEVLIAVIKEILEVSE